MGRFRSRAQLTKVPGIGPKTFEQAAGFLRIRDGENPLDMTAVHPESYPVVERIAASLEVHLAELIEKPALVDRKAGRIRSGSAGMFTLHDILEELRKPGRDPREQFVAPQFQASVREIADLQPGMMLEGVVTNVTKFGAFVDIGVHQDGLVHISELSNRFIKDPSEAVKVGQIVPASPITGGQNLMKITSSGGRPPSESPDEFILTYDGKPSYTVSIMEFRGDKVARETQYFADPFVAPAWRAQWVERMDT